MSQYYNLPAQQPADSQFTANEYEKMLKLLDLPRIDDACNKDYEAWIAACVDRRLREQNQDQSPRKS